MINSEENIEATGQHDLPTSISVLGPFSRKGDLNYPFPLGYTTVIAIYFFFGFPFKRFGEKSF